MAKSNQKKKNVLNIKLQPAVIPAQCPVIVRAVLACICVLCDETQLDDVLR